MRAPIAGRISDRKVDAGNLIQGGQQGATLLAASSPSTQFASCSTSRRSDYLRYTRLFLSGELASSRENNPVRIRLADETEWTRTGKVDFVGIRCAARSGTIRTGAVVRTRTSS